MIIIKTPRKKTKLVEQNNSFKTRSGGGGQSSRHRKCNLVVGSFFSHFKHTIILVHSHIHIESPNKYRCIAVPLKLTDTHTHTNTCTCTVKTKKKWELVDIRKTLANSVFMQTEPKGKLFSKSSIFSACWPKEETRNSSICNVLEAIRRKKG